jgi:peptidoglycan/LPS O-acetylase OafA/YrhL
MSTQAATADARIAGLDGIRGIATLAVIYAHLGLLGCGWIAMECFFVLSGFLITRVLLNDQSVAPTFGVYLKRFYLRRILRVFPVYYGYLLLLTLLTPVLPPGDEIGRQLPYAYSYVFNFFILYDGHTATKLLDHLWSMCVEEQFYLVWPLLIALLPGRKAAWALWLLVMAAPLTRAWVIMAWPGAPDDGLIENPYLAIYFLTSSHLDAFAIGALLNYVRLRPQPWQLALVLLLTVAAGVAASGWGIRPYVVGGDLFNFGWPMSLPRNWQSVWGYSLINLNCALLIAACCQPGLLQRFFQWRPLEFIGERSYPTYVFHYGILMLFTPAREWLIEAIGSRSLAALLISPAYLAVVLWVAHWIHERVEKPVFRLKNRFSVLANPTRSESVQPAADPAP